MYKVTIENLILKKGWDKVITNFYDPYVAFFVVMQFGTEQSKALIRTNVFDKVLHYKIKLGSDNTRFLKGESFDIDLGNSNQLWFQLALVENKSPTSISLEVLDNKLDINTQIEENNNLEPIEVIGFNLPINLLVPKDKIVFKNKLLELTFSFTLKNERL
jgi:hypothetical protein